MSNQGPTKKPAAPEQLLDLLLDALQERQAARKAGAPATVPPQAASQAAPAPQQSAAPAVPAAAAQPSVHRAAARATSPGKAPREPAPGEEGWQPPALVPSMNLARTLGRLLILIVVLIVLVNVPLNRYGVSLARIMPESQALIIRDGLILKGSGPEIYLLEEDKLRWISSLDAFEHLSLKWRDVHVVDDQFLHQFEQGRPIHVLLKCNESPHIYRIEGRQKRWIKDIDTFTAQGFVWEDVRFVSCVHLRQIPDGPPIPEDAGTPPVP